MNSAGFHEWLNDPRRRTLVMGVLNVTPDSFSDGGKYAKADAAIARAEQIAAEGADLIDFGGESTQPGAQPVNDDEQIRRVIPVLRAVARLLGVVCSIDTRSSRVAQAAIDQGAGMINDISAGRADPAMLPLAARAGVPIVLMHMQGTPATMQQDPHYADVVQEVSEFLKERLGAACAAGVDRRKILLDPGIGFGKSLEHNLALLRRQRELLALGQPLVIGTSRKRFIGAITGVEEPSRRIFGSLAACAWAAANGAGILRVHDVEASVQAVRVIEAIRANSP